MTRHSVHSEVELNLEYMPNKPYKWGIKLYELCESSSGYVHTKEVHGGANNVSYASDQVVLRLMAPLVNKGHALYTDNYYSSPTLFDKLVNLDTKTVGTVRTNRREIPLDFKTLKLARGEIAYRRRQNVMAIKWQDKREVNVLTTQHLSETVEVTTRTGAKAKPVAVHDYTQNMSGIDHSDQLISYMPFHRRCIKWWKKLFMHLFTLTLVNSHILHNKYLISKGECVWPLEKFILSVGQAFADDSSVNTDEAVMESPANRLSGRHFISKIPPTAYKEHPTRFCKVCNAKAKNEGNGIGPRQRKRKETRFWCRACDTALCLECFKEFHTRKMYNVET